MTARDAGGDVGDCLRIFLAMPGSDMGPDATWKDPDQVKRRFYDVIAKRLEAEVGRKVDLVIEKDKHRAGPIYSSMYSEAWIADVYLADLTGANANVYLELGVRWSMSDGVTILLAQDPSKLKFNVVATRAESYSIDPDVLERSIERVVRSIVDGLKVDARGGTDSPVRENGKVLSISAEELASLRTEVERLRSERGEDYLKAAGMTSTPETKVALLRRAVEVNPLAAESRFHLGLTLREMGRADAEAIDNLRHAAALAPLTSRYWRELGVALSKSGRPEEAIPQLERAIDLDPSDFDAVSALGGARRRLALAQAPVRVDWDLLRAARDSYERASKLAPRDTYPLLNVARLDLLLSKTDPSRGGAAKIRFAKVLPLCQFESEAARDAATTDDAGWPEKQTAAYRAFDYADCLLFSGRTLEGIEAYRNAINSVQVELRQDVFRSVLAGLKSIDALAHMDSSMVEALALVCSLLDHGVNEATRPPSGAMM
jgi:tetratricopeptide (TPR) repeat protein